MKDRVKVVFVCNTLNSPFIQSDLKILRDFCDVSVINFRLENKSFLYLLKMTFKLFKECRKCDLSYSWFADYPAFLAVLFSKMLKKKSIVISGGHDVVGFREINFGNRLKPWISLFGKYSLKNADAVLAFSKESERLILNWIPDAKVKLVYVGGIDSNKFKPKGTKKEIVVNVARLTKEHILRKGLKTYVESARHLPDIKFKLVGSSKDGTREYLEKIAPPNVEFMGYLPEKDLIKTYQEAMVNVEVAYHAGFGIAVAEGMACECVPVVTKKAGALEEVVGDTGVFVPYGDSKSTAEGIKMALKMAKSGKGKLARKRVVELFPLSSRKKNLKEIIFKLVKSV